MSIGNLKSEGNKGNNFPWQYKMLLGLQGIINSNTDCCEALTTLLRPQVRTPRVVRTSGPFTNAVAVYSFSIANVGAGNGTALGVTIKPGEIVNFDASAMNNYFGIGAITADGTGTELLISYIF
jgi:hypothetical protein